MVQAQVQQVDSTKRVITQMRSALNSAGDAKSRENLERTISQLEIIGRAIRDAHSVYSRKDVRYSIEWVGGRVTSVRVVYPEAESSNVPLQQKLHQSRIDSYLRVNGFSRYN